MTVGGAAAPRRLNSDNGETKQMQNEEITKDAYGKFYRKMLSEMKLRLSAETREDETALLAAIAKEMRRQEFSSAGFELLQVSENANGEKFEEYQKREDLGENTQISAKVRFYPATPIYIPSLTITKNGASISRDAELDEQFSVKKVISHISQIAGHYSAPLTLRREPPERFELRPVYLISESDPYYLLHHDGNYLTDEKLASLRAVYNETEEAGRFDDESVEDYDDGERFEAFLEWLEETHGYTQIYAFDLIYKFDE